MLQGMGRSPLMHLGATPGPRSIRAVTGTLLLNAGTDIREVQQLLGHKHVTVTQVYDKRRRDTRDSASHRLSL